ncbi:hypothetical protein JX265_004996 [Neoarthrinium moseri]|uniref:Uncharacterized protein n=1 Tax=Neoarthrinium moseri TaxID=1658444 RepID=A0A9P9WP72_9PEZI|nr:uncharacterized protein JN550_009280 [Neoarthrinium moseri]KAI1846480.1 hypothetical protein JX266_007377 [Neoarthrinium moseri]KAI1864001.1 hypothetical protein JN550_009280 [Neoarthrinium moseri]KAI1873374.1 hypothetical protein JX265_004996 [Neoarthrinium moseri]
MSYNTSWDHQYCLSCDRQTDGATYCSESCRLSDFDKSSTTCSTPISSPGLTGSNFSWTSPRPQTKFYLSPAYDFSNAQPYGSTPQPQPLFRRHESLPSVGQLTPSSSYSSLSSMQSTSSRGGGEGRQLSDKAKKQLRDYASSFNIQRRRSC